MEAKVRQRLATSRKECNAKSAPGIQTKCNVAITLLIPLVRNRETWSCYRWSGRKQKEMTVRKAMDPQQHETRRRTTPVPFSF
jgi:hypothetical protein